MTRTIAIAELTGGLGNQLFQFAAARALCLREGRRLAFAWHLHRGDTQRWFMLDAFRLGSDVPRAPLGNLELVARGLRTPLGLRRAAGPWRRAVCRLHELTEPSFAYTPLASDAEAVVLEGYFQSYRYFEDCARVIRAELQVREPPRGRNAELLVRMRDQNAICLHVRRGDYASDPTTQAFHGLMGLEYYRAALELLAEQRRGATYYVFSDEPAWAREHLQTGGETVFVDHNGPDRPWEDLRLMRACRHFVIANSSLSWWGAWLAGGDGMRVAPARWFRDGNVDTRDLCPPAWLRI